MKRYPETLAILFIVLLLSIGVLPGAGHAGSVLWNKKLDQEVRWHRVTDLGTLLVGTDEDITCYNPESGEVAWKRDDLKKIPEAMVDEIKGTPLLLVSQNTGWARAATKLHALDLLTGKTIWESEKLKGFTVGVEPVYEKNFVLILTSGSKSATKDKLDMIALNMINGNVLWESEFDDKVDLHEAETSGRFGKSFDLSGHQPPVHDGDEVYFTYAGLHRHDINTGKLIWKVPYDVTEGQIKRGNAQAIIAEDAVYTSVKGQLKAIDKNTGQVRWTSKDFGGAVAEMVVKGDVIYGRLGGSFYDRSKKEWELKKPLGVVAVDRKTGEMIWRYDDAEDSITNMVVLDDLGTVLIADAKKLIGLDTNSRGNAKEAFKVKVEFRKKIGAGAIAGGVGRFALGGLRGLGAKGKGDEDPPVAISMRKNGIAVVRGKQHLVAFDPKTREIAWSVQYAAPGVPGWAKLTMGAITMATYTAYTAQAASTYAGTSENQWANEGRFQALKDYSELAGRRYTATGATDLYTYILTDVQEGGEKGAGIIGVNMDTGDSDRQVMFKEKEPNYKVDEVTGRVFMVKDDGDLTAFSVK